MGAGVHAIHNYLKTLNVEGVKLKSQNSTNLIAQFPYVIAWGEIYAGHIDQDSVLSQYPYLQTLLRGTLVEQANFRFLPVNERERTVGGYVRILPCYIFEKEIVFHPQKGVFDKFLDFFRVTPSAPPEPVKSHLIIGSSYPEPLLDIVLACGCVLSGDKEQFFQKIRPNLFIALDDDYEFGNEGSDLYSFMLDHDIDSDTSIEIRHARFLYVPAEKRWTEIKNLPVFVPPYIYQAQLLITDNNFLYPEESKVETRRINIGAQTQDELIDIIDFLELTDDTQGENDTANTRERIPDDVKMYVWKRDEGKCVICGSQEKLEFDHIIPFSKGGSNTARNLQLLCEKCNRSKGAKI